MADKSIGELTKAKEIYTDSLFVMEQSGQAMSVSGEVLSNYAKSEASAYVGQAIDAAETAVESRDVAVEAAKDAAAIATKPPIIRDGHWWTWDTGIDDYADSGLDAGVSLSIGQVTTGAPGTEAAVTNSGTLTDPVLDFVIPRGEKGETGGVDSVNGHTGDVTLTAADVGALPDSGAVPIAKGGTGKTGAFAALEALGGLSLASLGTNIPGGADLNTYTTPGTYYVSVKADAEGIQNTPYTESGYKLYVIRANTNARGLQLAINTVAGIYVRYWAESGGTFGPWRTVLTNTVSAASLNQDAPLALDQLRADVDYLAAMQGVEL